MPHGLIYNATWDSSTKTLAFYDRSGNIVYSCVVDVSPQPIVDDPTKPLYIRCMSPDGGTIYLTGTAITTDTFERSTDGVTWEPWQIGSVGTITLGQGQGIYIRAASARTEFPSSNMISIIMNGGADVRFEAYHNVNSMLSPNFTSITDLTTLASDGANCLKRLFYQQRQLSKAPLLPATKLSKGCYQEMFHTCTSLLETPEFPWTSTEAASCTAMFSGCSNLSVVHDLHASIVAGRGEAPLNSGAYQNMFNGCTSLISPPTLSATECGLGGCARMFYGCSSLTTAPVLPTTVTGNYAFERMFQGCTSLTKSPLIAVDTLTPSCCNYMFSGCTSLHEIHINSTDISASSCLSNWVSNVAPTGDFYCVEGVPFTVDSSSGIPLGWTVHRTAVDSPNLPLYLKSTQNGSTVALNKLSTHSSSDVYQKSTDNVNWTDFDSAVTLNDGDGIFVRISANRATTFSNNLHVQFVMSGAIQAYNNINSLLSPTFSTLSDLTTVVGSGAYCHCRLFDSCTALTKVPLLPSTTLSKGCYRATFTGCTGLTQPPELPATAMAESCYRAMFEGCTGLTQAPAIPAMTLAPYCYYYMLKGCTFTAAPVLPATTLADYCYGGLFNNCTSLVTAPAMAATTLAPYCCQQMFGGCTSLMRGPDLLALTTTDNCYTRIFVDCSSLNEVHLYATSDTSSGLYLWLSGVSASGTVYCDPSITLTADSPSGLPTGWIRAALS